MEVGRLKVKGDFSRGSCVEFCNSGKKENGTDQRFSGRHEFHLSDST